MQNKLRRSARVTAEPTSDGARSRASTSRVVRQVSRCSEPASQFPPKRTLAAGAAAPRGLQSAWHAPSRRPALAFRRGFPSAAAGCLGGGDLSLLPTRPLAALNKVDAGQVGSHHKERAQSGACLAPRHTRPPHAPAPESPTTPAAPGMDHHESLVTGARRAEGHPATPIYFPPPGHATSRPALAHRHTARAPIRPLPRTRHAGTRAVAWWLVAWRAGFWLVAQLSSSSNQNQLGSPRARERDDLRAPT